MANASVATTSQTRLEDFLPSVASTSGGGLHSNSDEPPRAVQQVKRDRHAQRVYVLCGVVGSGKSTLATQLEGLYPAHYVRVNQDSLGNRQKCEALTQRALREGKSPVIDRQNFEPSQRYPWLALGHEAGVEVVALVFHTSSDVCEKRLKLRRNHETIKSAEQGVSILRSIVSQWTPPQLVEGFHRIVQLPADLPLRYDYNNCNDLLDRIDATPSTPAILPPEAPAPSPRFGPFAGRGQGYRGRSRGSGGTMQHHLSPSHERNIMSDWLQPRSAQPAIPPRRPGQAPPSRLLRTSQPTGSSRANPYVVPDRR